MHCELSWGPKKACEGESMSEGSQRVYRKRKLVQVAPWKAPEKFGASKDYHKLVLD